MRWLLQSTQNVKKQQQQQQKPSKGKSKDEEMNAVHSAVMILKTFTLPLSKKEY